MHANPLPYVGCDGTFLACPPGSLVVSRGLIGGVALASTDATIGGVLHWFALGHKNHLMDVALAESYGWVIWWPFKAISRKTKSKPKPKPKSRKGKEKAGEEVEDVEEEQEENNEVWCICNLVVVVGCGHGWKCVVVIHYVSFLSKGRVASGFFFVCLSSAPLYMVAVLQVEFFIDWQRFQLLCSVLQWPTHVFTSLRAARFEPHTLRAQV